MPPPRTLQIDMYWYEWRVRTRTAPHQQSLAGQIFQGRYVYVVLTLTHNLYFVPGTSYRHHLSSAYYQGTYVPGMTLAIRSVVTCVGCLELLDIV